MASTQPLRCLARPTLAARSRIQSTAILSSASLSTTSGRAAATVPGVKNRRELAAPMKKNYKKGTPKVVDVKKPNPGERKAFRKRIQLSNNSALSVTGTQPMDGKTLAQDESSGKMVALPNEVVDQLRALEAFKPTQSWGLFRAPHFLVREETVKLIQKIEGAKDKKEALNCVISGDRLSGKSLMMVQAMSHALSNKWVVINIPEGQELTNGQTEYAPLPNTTPLQFTQPAYTLKLLQNIYKANKTVLETLNIQKESSRVGNLKSGATLADLAQGAKDSEYAWQTLEALLTELMLPGRPPLMLCLDGLAHINKVSAYRDPSFNEVHSHDLALVRAFVDAISGKTKLPNGGAVLAANSGNNTHYHPSQELVLSQLEAGQAGREIPKPGPYERGYDDRVYDALKNAYVHRVDGVTKDEARTLMEYWGASGLIRKVLNWQTVTEKWALGGNGLVGEMERASLLNMRM